jgi:hypothetical protein
MIPCNQADDETLSLIEVKAGFLDNKTQSGLVVALLPFEPAYIVQQSTAVELEAPPLAHAVKFGQAVEDAEGQSRNLLGVFSLIVAPGGQS